MAQLSDDCFAHGGALLRLDAAIALLVERTDTVVGTEGVSLGDAAGRVLAEDLVAGVDVPPKDNSAVDGYAVRFEDLHPDADTLLPVAGRAAAGHPLATPAGRGTAVRIFTGAVMPDGPDTVMMQEDCVEETGPDGPMVRIRPGIDRGANRRRRGEDVTAGTAVLSRGQRLRPQDVGLAASVGAERLSVYGRVRVALFSTGDELSDPGAVPAAGGIYDSNRHTLRSLLLAAGCTVTDLGILPDDASVIQEALESAADEHDLIVTSGGMSVGEEDHVAAAVEALGALHFWKLAIKPGRPVALGQVGRVPFVGLPGNPVAVMVTFLHIARPLIQRLGGAALTPPRLYPVVAGFAHKKKLDRREWVRAQLVAAPDGGWIARKFPRQGAGILSSMVAADGLVELPEDLTYLEEGERVPFLPFSEVGIQG